MSATTQASPVQACANVVTNLAISNQPENRGYSLGFQKFLISEQNKLGFNLQVRNGKGIPFAGSGCTLNIQYLALGCGTTTNDLSLCNLTTPTTTIPLRNAPFEFKPTDVTSVPRQIDSAIFNCICVDRNEMQAKILANDVLDIFLANEAKLLNCAFDCMGKYCNGDISTVTPQTAYIFNSAGVNQPTGWNVVFQNLNEMKVSGKPTIIGGSAIKQYQHNQAIGASGYNGLGLANPADTDLGFNLMYSSKFDAVMASKGLVGSYAYVIMPGTMQMINYVQYTPDNIDSEVSDKSKAALVARHTYDGVALELDYRAVKDPSCDYWKILQRLISGLWCMPDSDFCDGQSTGRFLIKLDCGDVQCALPCGSAAPPPIAPRKPIEKEATK